jgi:amino-acid N-acetyltransferase
MRATDMNAPTLRTAKPSDTRAILGLVGHFSALGLMLPRSYADVLERIRDFTVAVTDDDTLKGVVGLHPVGEDLAEIRSLAVAEDLRGKGVGRRLVESCLQEASQMGLQRVFALTYQTAFFDKLGFAKVEKLTLPQKIWGDCVHCAKFSDCDEVAVLKTLGEP